FPTKRHHAKTGGLVAPPIVPAVVSRDGVTCSFWCKFCDAYHTHGAGNGGRRSHCAVIDSPYRTAGLLLVMVQGRLGDLKPPTAERRKPRPGPFGTKVHGWEEEAKV